MEGGGMLSRCLGDLRCMAAMWFARLEKALNLKERRELVWLGCYCKYSITNMQGPLS